MLEPDPAPGSWARVPLSLIGLALLVGAVALWVDAAKPPATWSDPPNFGLASFGSEGMFLVDARSGRVWKKVCDPGTSEIPPKPGACPGFDVFLEIYVSEVTPLTARGAVAYNTFNNETIRAQALAPQPRGP